MNSLGQHQDEEYYVRVDVGVILRHPFRRSVHSVVWDGLIVICPSDHYEIPAHEPSGALKLIVRRDHSNRMVTQADVDAYVAERLGAADPQTIYRQPQFCRSQPQYVASDIHGNVDIFLLRSDTRLLLSG